MDPRASRVLLHEAASPRATRSAGRHLSRYSVIFSILLGFLMFGEVLGRPRELVERHHRTHSLHKRHHFLLPSTSSQMELGDGRELRGFEESNSLQSVHPLPIDQEVELEENQLDLNPLLPLDDEEDSDSDAWRSKERIDRDARDLVELDSVSANQEGNVQLAQTHRITKADESPESQPMRGQKDPLSVRDGHYVYSVGNSTEQKTQALEAFRMLKAEPSEDERLDVEKPKKYKPLQNLPSEQRVKQVHKARKKKPGQKLNGRNEALMSAMEAGNHRRQTCMTEKFKQRVKMPGCLTKVIVNRFCHGTCTSFFIPRMKANRLKASFQSCAACVPKEYDTMDVTLDCPGMDVPHVTKSIVIVKKCECMAVNPVFDL